MADTGFVEKGWSVKLPARKVLFFFFKYKIVKA